MIDLLVSGAHEVVTSRTGPGGAVGAALERLEVIPRGAVAVDRGRIVAVGPTPALARRYRARRTLDARGRLVSPAFVDPHSHLVYAGSRHVEYEALVTGVAAPEKRLRGGIRYTVSRTRRASAAALRRQALADLDLMLVHGTTTVEAKSGYGLDRATELRLLRVIHALRHPVDVVATFMGAHVLPEEYRGRRQAYVELVIAVARAGRRYAEYCDVCCDPVAFTVAECERIAQAARGMGYRLKVHADQMGPIGGAELAARLGAASADHLDYVSPAGIRALARSGTVGVLLPGVTHHMLEMTPKLVGRRLVPAVKAFWPRLARRLIDGGVRLALSADYNPGTSPTPSMQAVMQLAARLYRLSYAAIWHMATINAAHALDRGDDRGSLEPGKRADLVIWRVAEHGMVVNRFGVNLVDTVVKDGRVLVRDGVRVSG
ncbi:MAG TPA: imidazolonepropionase [Methylomirabilota bacterium]|nr:imidazolonepropionase [Methylomirabilota bacterium]